MRITLVPFLALLASFTVYNVLSAPLHAIVSDVEEVVTPLDKRAVPSSTRCGSNRYTGSQIQAAINAARDYYASGDEPGGYPHQFNNYEDLPLQCGSGAWYEFPLKSGSTYSGGSPGADRVVYKGTTGAYCASITHTGSSTNNGFVSCTDS